jgi:hypothetical protein
MSEQDSPTVYLSNMPYGTVASNIQAELDRDGLEFVRNRIILPNLITTHCNGYRSLCLPIEVQVSVETITRGVKGWKQASGLAIVKFFTEESATKMEKNWAGREFDGRPLWMSRRVWLHSLYVQNMEQRSLICAGDAVGMDSLMGQK